jgi:hypothetical protein
MIVDELVAILGYDIKGEANLKRFNRGMEQTVQLAQRAAATLVALGTVAAAALAAVGKGVIDVSAQFEGFETSLTTIEGSADKAKQSMSWIQDFATKTPYEMAELTRAFIKLRNAGLDPTDGSLETLGDTASAMNVPLNQAVEAMTDAMTFQFERLKEFGITSSQKGDQVTFTWTKNGKQLSKTVKKNGDEVRKFILQNLGDRFNGAMIRQSKTWNGMMANLGDAWTNFQKRIGDGGFFENMKSRLAGLLDRISALADDGTLGRWADNISAALTKAADFIGSAVENIIKGVRQIADFFSEHSDLFGPLKWALLGLGIALFPVTSLLIGAALALDEFLSYMRGGDSVIGDFIAKIQEIMPSLKDIPWQLKSLKFYDVGKSLGKALVEGFAGLGAAIAQSIDWAWVVSAWVGALKAQFQFVNGVFQGVGESIGNAILAGLTAMGGKIRDWFQRILPDWAAEFFAYRAKAADALNSKATDATGRRQKFERDAPTSSANQNTPGVADRMAEMARQERFRNWGNAAENFRINAMRSGGMSGATVNASTYVTINLKVDQITQAANAAASAVKDAVASKLSSISPLPTRKVKSPTF